MGSLSYDDSLSILLNVCICVCVCDQQPAKCDKIVLFVIPRLYALGDNESLAAHDSLQLTNSGSGILSGSLEGHTVFHAMQVR